MVYFNFNIIILDHHLLNFKIHLNQGQLKNCHLNLIAHFLKDINNHHYLHMDYLHNYFIMEFINYFINPYMDLIIYFTTMDYKHFN